MHPRKTTEAAVYGGEMMDSEFEQQSGELAAEVALPEPTDEQLDDACRWIRCAVEPERADYTSRREEVVRMVAEAFIAQNAIAALRSRVAELTAEAKFAWKCRHDWFAATGEANRARYVAERERDDARASERTAQELYLGLTELYGALAQEVLTPKSAHSAALAEVERLRGEMAWKEPAQLNYYMPRDGMLMWTLDFDDTDVDNEVYYSEAEAVAAWEKRQNSWNCSVVGPLRRHPARSAEKEKGAEG